MLLLIVYTHVPGTRSAFYFLRNRYVYKQNTRWNKDETNGRQFY